MILKRITVRRFKALKEKNIEFTPGLNIIKGSDNEAGKSSLREAIVKALYEDPTTTKKEIAELTSWGMEEPWEVELDFESNSKSYRIIKSMKDGSSKLIDRSTSETMTDKNAIKNKVAELTGCPSEVFFESTACIRQDELIGIIPQTVTPGEKETTLGVITKRLQGTLAGTEGVDVSTIVSKLYKKTHRQAAKGPYYDLQETNKRIRPLEPDKVSLQQKVTTVMENRRELNQTKEELQEINKNLPQKERLLEKNMKILELEKDILRDRNQYENFTRAKKLRSKLNDQDEEMGELECFKGAEAKVECIKTVKSNIESLERQRTGLEEKTGTPQPQKPASWLLVLGLIFISIGIILGVISVAVGSSVGIVSVVGLITIAGSLLAAAGGLVLSAYWLVRLIIWRTQTKATVVIDIDRGELDSSIQDSRDEVGNILSELGFDSLDACLQSFEDYTGKLAGRKETKDMLKGITGDKTWDQFEKENSELDIQVSAAQKELKNYGPFKIDDPLELQSLEDEVSELQAKEKELEQKKTGLGEFLKLTDGDTDRLASVTEEMKWLEEERAFYERKMRVYDICREALAEAHSQTLSKATNALEKELGKYIFAITDGRYKQVRVSEKDLSIWTVPPEKKDEVEVAQLSRATQDQFYISARFALVKIITEGKRVPLLLDDPFVNFHLKRLQKMMSLIQELAKENQILLFTCADAYDNCGNVISVD